MKDIVTLSDNKLEAAGELILVLKPMKTITTLMCDSKHPTIALIHPIMEMPKQQIALKDSDSGLVKHVKKNYFEWQQQCKKIENFSVHC